MIQSFQFYSFFFCMQLKNVMLCVHYSSSTVLYECFRPGFLSDGRVTKCHACSAPQQMRARVDFSTRRPEVPIDPPMIDRENESICAA